MGVQRRLAAAALAQQAAQKAAGQALWWRAPPAAVMPPAALPAAVLACPAAAVAVKAATVSPAAAVAAPVAVLSAVQAAARAAEVLQQLVAAQAAQLQMLGAVWPALRWRPLELYLRAPLAAVQHCQLVAVCRPLVPADPPGPRPQLQVLPPAGLGRAACQPPWAAMTTGKAWTMIRMPTGLV